MISDNPEVKRPPHSLWDTRSCIFFYPTTAQHVMIGSGEHFLLQLTSFDKEFLPATLIASEFGIDLDEQISFPGYESLS